MNDTELIERINTLKKERGAVILAHNYQRDEVQRIADHTGDSLGLSRLAAQVDADVIVFCGVHFMAESASILAPEKTILLPDVHAGCPMADMITGADVRELKKEHPGALVLAYVNTSAEVKAETDICCTSSNALKVVESLPEDQEIIFIPDKYLAHWVSRKTGRTFITWEGYCPTHAKILPEDVQAQKAAHPDAVVLAHPECPAAVLDLADEVLSTTGILNSAKNSPATEFIIATEHGILYSLRENNPGKKFYFASKHALCPNMKKITLEKIMWSLERMQPEVRVPEELRVKAWKAVDRMVAIG
jgi:quinolinate synthase